MAGEPGRVETPRPPVCRKAIRPAAHFLRSLAQSLRKTPHPTPRLGRNSPAVAGPFLWLSLQSLVVVATALWFRSRFIVVANFFIFLAIVLGYMVLNDGGERGVCFGFGFVALVTARVLNWKKERLELKTGFMRNAYLASAFVVIPYALYHVVPHAYVGVSWVGVALFYYAMNVIVRNPRYRWMGHLTLLGTVLYLLIIGITQLTAAYRILSFLLLGGVLLAISLLFTQLRRRSRRAESAGPPHNL